VVNFDAYAQTAVELANRPLVEPGDLEDLLGPDSYSATNATDRDLTALRRAGKRLRQVFELGSAGRDGDAVVTLSSGATLRGDTVLVAAGRTSNTEALGLETAGVRLNENGAVAVDAYSKTNVDNIWAVGDVTDRINLTPVAIREGAAFAETEFYGRPTAFDHETVASAVFSQPPVGAVGLTEFDARRKHGKVDVYRSVFRPLKSTFYGGDDRMLTKLVVEKGSERVVGCHIVGPDAPEMIQMAAIAIKMGVTKRQWDDTCAVHPTAAEELVTMREPYVVPQLAMSG